MFKHLALIATCLTLAVGAVHGQTTTVNFDSGDFQILDQNTAATNPLTAGPAGDGNGAILQLGYFTGANFTGTFVPLSGQGSANTAIVPGSSPPEMYNQTSIGDRGAFFAGPGTFSLQLSFTSTDPTSNNNLPASGTPLAIRFYNGTTLASSTFFNTVSSTSTTWQWQSPNTPPALVEISLNDPGLLWESVVRAGQASNTAFHTTIPIPEPSTIALIGFALVGAPIVYLRRRLKG